jgi:hypothetical protein
MSGLSDIEEIGEDYVKHEANRTKQLLLTHPTKICASGQLFLHHMSYVPEKKVPKIIQNAGTNVIYSNI